MTRIALWPALILAIAAAPSTAIAQGIELDKRVYRWGEAISIRYALPDDGERYDLVVRPEELPEGLASLQGLSEILRDRRGAKRIESDLLAFPLASDTSGYSARDPARAIYDVRLVGPTAPGAAPEILARAKILLLRDIRPDSGALDLRGRRRFATGEAIVMRVQPTEVGAVRMRGLISIADAKCCLNLRLYRLGYAVPRGAAVVDRLIQSWPLDPPLKPETILAPDPALDPGEYELRLVAPGGAVLDRARFDVSWPDRANALRVEAAPGQRRSEATAILRVDGFVPGERLRVLRVGRDGVLQYLDEVYDLPPSALNASGGTIELGVDAAPGPVPALPPRPPGLDDATWRRIAESLERGRAARLTPVPPPGWLAPGEYEARLYVTTYGEVLDLQQGRDRLEPWNREYIRSAVRFRIGGTTRHGWADKPLAPDIPYGAAKIVLKAPPVPVESDIDATVSLPPGLKAAGAPVWLALFRKAGATQGQRYEDTHVSGPTPLGDGRVTIRAPHLPGNYEVRLYRGETPDGAALQFPPAELLARADVEVVVPALPRALRLAGGERIEVHQPGLLIVQMPKRHYRDGYRVELVSAADVLPGGAVREPERLREMQVTRCFMRIPIAPIHVVGNYELRLFDRAEDQPARRERFGVTRLHFAVVDSEAPPWPAGSEPRAARESDWPAVAGAADEKTDVDPECAPPARVAAGGRWPQEGP